MGEKIKVYVCFHNENQIEDIQKNTKNDEIYIPLFLGSKGKDALGCCNDSEGDNISYLNPNLSELTGLYWMAKNSDANIIGLCHYRRYFIVHNYNGRLLNKKDILKYLSDYDIILPRSNEPLQGTNYETFKGLDESFDLAYEIIKKDYPNYLKEFNKVINTEYPLSFFNMFICNKKIINEYCDWIFPILFQILEEIDLSNNPRILGVTSEILFNVFIYHKNLKIKEVPLRFNERKMKIKNFIYKIKLLRILYKHIYYPLISIRNNPNK